MEKLIIIIREDVAQLTPTEIVKQVAFVTSLFYNNLRDEEFLTYYQSRRINETSITDQATRWADQHDGYGEIFILTANLVKMQELDRMCYNSGVLANMLINPALPQKNHFGKKFTIKTATAMYMLVDLDVDIEIMKKVQNWCVDLNIDG